MVTRRKVLIGAGLTTLGVGGYVYDRGLRLPTLHLDPLALKNTFSLEDGSQLIGKEVIRTPNKDRNLNELSACFRAFAPQPSLTFLPNHLGSVSISVDNISPEAQLQTNTPSQVSEEASKARRRLLIEAKTNQAIELSWKLPDFGDYTFATIGDTGGDKELDWCIQRAADLGAKFLLHLGDFNYQDGDYDRSIKAFNNSPIPIYVTIGNHDFHDDGAIYPQFLREIGPLNNTFSIGQTRFANIDTAANVFPYGAGQRGAMFERMMNDPNYTDTVCFTHCPLHDPDPNSDHDMGSTGERDWLINALKKVGAKPLLSGHIHIYHRSDFDGIDNIIVGQGLGHQDLLINDDASKIVLGHVDQNGAVKYTAEPLAMPLEAHCHPRIDPVKESLRGGEHNELIKMLDKVCQI